MTMDMKRVTPGPVNIRSHIRRRTGKEGSPGVKNNNGTAANKNGITTKALMKIKDGLILAPTVTRMSRIQALSIPNQAPSEINKIDKIYPKARITLVRGSS
jgi:hypothetical protein